MKKLLALLILPVALLFIFTAPVFAEMQPSLNPTVEGPGFLLPDSPFYFLDKLKQHIRLAFAVSPEQKATVYESVAGERLAEARFELIKNNLDYAFVALQGVQENSRKAGEFVQKAKDYGHDSSKLAGDINSSIKGHQNILDDLEPKATGELKAEVHVVQAALADAKQVVEASLPKALLDQEVHEDLLRQSVQSAKNTKDSAISLQQSLNLLQLQATTAAKTAPTIKTNKPGAALYLADQKRADSVSSALQAQVTADVKDIVQKAEEVANTLQSATQVVSSQDK